MIYVSVNYMYSPGFNSPESWLKRISTYNGVMECLAKTATVITINRIDYNGAYVHKGVQHRFVNFGKKKTYFPWQLNRFIRNLKPDVIIMQGLHHPVQFIQLCLLLPKNTRIIAQHHAEKPFKGPKKNLQRLADRYIDAYLFAARQLGAEWVNNGNISSARKIHEVMEVSSIFHPINKKLAQSITKAVGNPVFLWVGRLNSNKDPFTVINAFLKFGSIQKKAMLYMIYHTDDLLPAIIDQIKDHPQKEKIVLIGKVPNENLLYWYNSADFFLSGSHYEGSGAAICEAMSCGCIPVVTDISAFRTITDNGKCGLLYEAGNEANLLSALLQTQTIDLAEKRKACVDYYRLTLSFEAIAAKINQIASSLYSNN